MPAERGRHRFVRTLEYRFDGWSMRLANLFLLRRRIERESEVHAPPASGRRGADSGGESV